MGFVTNLGVGMGEQLECWLLPPPPPELKIFPPPGLGPPPCGDEEIGMNMFCLNPCSGVKLPGLTPPERQQWGIIRSEGSDNGNYLWQC